MSLPGCAGHSGPVIDSVQVSPHKRMLRVGRRVVGAVLLIAGAGTAVIFALAAWNPWSLVVLEYRFGNLMLGLLVAPVLLLAGLWLALPVHNEARQRWRILARWLAGAMVLVGLFGWGLFGAHFQFDAEELARAEGSGLAVAEVRDRDTSPRIYVRVWSGSGLTAHEVGEIGRVCGAVSAEFVGEHRVEVATTYGDWTIDLDPETGAPLQMLGPGCADDPVPATGR